MWFGFLDGSLLRLYHLIASLFTPGLHVPGLTDPLPGLEPGQQSVSEPGLLDGCRPEESSQLTTAAGVQQSNNIDNNKNSGSNNGGDGDDSRDSIRGSSDTSNDCGPDGVSQPGFHSKKSYATSATSELPPTSADDPETIIHANGRKLEEVQHVGSRFGGTEFNYTVSAEDSVYLPITNTAAPSGPRLVKDTPTIQQARGQQSPSEASKSRQGEDTQSTGSLARSASSYKRGSGREFQDRLMLSRKRSVPADKLFYPNNIFSSIITIECVKQQIKTAFPDEDEETITKLAHQIHERTENCKQNPEISLGQGDVTSSGYTRIFVVLVGLDKTKDIRNFIESGIDDSSLPLQRVSRPNEDVIFDLCSSTEPNAPIWFISENWTPDEIERFYDNQWAVIAPFFSKSTDRKSVRHYKLSKNVILPFVHGHGTAPQNFQGGTAEVSRVFIHDDNHSFGTRKDFTGSFAVKRLPLSSFSSFKNEVDMLKKFSDDDAYPHLISLLATYEYNDHFHMVFDWAERNLKGYWEHVQPRPSATDRKTVLWVGEQCKGIAHVIVDLHKYKTFDLSQTGQSPIVIFGHHGDIKEENILWFPGTEGPQGDPNRGILKLADFGLARFRSNNTRSLDAAKGLCATPSYRSPESDLNNLQGRSYDIWTLGILYLQIITWLLGGWPLLQDFTMKRKCPDPSWRYWETDTFFERNPTAEGTSKTLHIIKPVVTRFIEELHHNKSCTTFLHEFLDLIAEQMLIVEGSEKVRISATNLYAELKRMVKRCSEDDVYALTPSQWGKSQPCGHGRPAAVEPLSTQNLMKLESQEGPSC